MKLTTRNLVKLEKKLGKNPLSVFMGVEKGEMPTLTDLLVIWQYILMADDEKYEKLDAVYEKYDDFVREGGDLVALMNEIIATLQESGVIPKNAEMGQ